VHSALKGLRIACGRTDRPPNATRFVLVEITVHLLETGNFCSEYSNFSYSMHTRVYAIPEATALQYCRIPGIAQ
jgi:hypothetical protein